jgi:hypothetical protein
MVRCFAMPMSRPVWMGFLLASSLNQALAWPWSPATPEVRETPLERPELAQLRLAAGWQPESPQVLIVDVGNRLSGPVICRSLSVQRKDDTQASLPLQPPLYVPVGATRRVSVPGVSKSQMKQWGLSCNCFKQAPGRACEAAP